MARAEEPEYWNQEKWEQLLIELKAALSDDFDKSSYRQGLKAPMAKWTLSVRGNFSAIVAKRCITNLLALADKEREAFSKAFSGLPNGWKERCDGEGFDAAYRLVNNLTNSNFKFKPDEKSIEIGTGKTIGRWLKLENYPPEAMLNVMVIAIKGEYISWKHYRSGAAAPGKVIIAECDPPGQPGKLRARVAFGEIEYMVEVVNPLDRAAKEEMTWHFEQFLDKAAIFSKRSNRTSGILGDAGKALFAMVFDSPRHVEDLAAMRSVAIRAGERMHIEVQAKTMAFDAIPWETLRMDADLTPMIGGLHGCVITRRSLGPSHAVKHALNFTAINLLIVTARPFEEQDVDYQTIQKPIVDATQDIWGTSAEMVPMQVEILRPGSFEALVAHLRTHIGHYQIIHFDTHGIVSDYNKLKKKRDTDHVYNFRAFRSFDPGKGVVARIEAFEGREAFLLFEQSTLNKVADVVKAVEIADMLAQSGIPICIINACQTSESGHEGNETNMARLIHERGINFVVGMKASISADAARIFSVAFYQALQKGASPMMAFNEAQQAIYRDKDRGTATGMTIQIEDWVLPTAYSHAPIKFQTQSSSALRRDHQPISRRLDLRSFGEQYIHRDIDILRIEKLLLTTSRLSLNGMKGIGKSTLAKQLADWWLETYFTKRTLYCPIDSVTMTFDALIKKIATELGQGVAEKEDACLQSLRDVPSILIIDIEGDVVVTSPEFNKQIGKRLGAFLSRIAGNCKVVVVSPSSSILKDFQFASNQVFTLRGLSLSDSFKLCRIVIGCNSQQWGELRRNVRFEYRLKGLSGTPGAIVEFAGGLKLALGKGTVAEFLG